MAGSEQLKSPLAQQVYAKLRELGLGGREALAPLATFEGGLSETNSVSYAGIVYRDLGRFRPFLDVLICTKVPFDLDKPPTLERIRGIDRVHDQLKVDLHPEDSSFRGFDSRLIYVKWTRRLPLMDDFIEVLNGLTKRSSRNVFYGPLPLLAGAVLGYRNFPSGR